MFPLQEIESVVQWDYYYTILLIFSKYRTKIQIPIIKFCRNKTKYFICKKISNDNYFGRLVYIYELYLKLMLQLSTDCKGTIKNMFTIVDCRLSASKNKCKTLPYYLN